MSKGNLPLAEGGLEWADPVTVKPKAELLHLIFYVLCKYIESGKEQYMPKQKKYPTGIRIPIKNSPPAMVSYNQK